jgi:hypothetical protein
MKKNNPYLAAAIDSLIKAEEYVIKSGYPCAKVLNITIAQLADELCSHAEGNPTEHPSNDLESLQRARESVQSYLRMLDNEELLRRDCNE